MKPLQQAFPRACLLFFLCLPLAVAQDETGEETANETEQDVAGEIQPEAGPDEQQPETEDDLSADVAEAVAGEGGEEPGAPMGIGQIRNFVLQGHPVFTPERARQVYQPLVEYLNQNTPYRFELRTARDFHHYWQDIRRNRTPDLVLEDAHIAALRISRDDYVPLVRAEQPLTFRMLTMDEGSGEPPELSDFNGRAIASMPAPSLGYLVLSNWYQNPMQQPVFQSSASSWNDAVEIVFSMEADAAIVPDVLASRHENMLEVESSQEFPGLTLAAAPNLSAEALDAITVAMRELHEDPDHYAALNELDVDRFVPASTIEYEGLELLVEEVFGFY